MTDHLTRLTGVEFLRDWQERYTGAHDPTKEPDLRCPHCSCAMTVRPSRRRMNVMVWHPPRRCDDAERFWHYVGAATREEAIEKHLAYA